MKNFSSAMEYFWLFLAIASAIFAGYMITVHGWNRGAMYLIFPSIAGFGWGVRRVMRKRLEKFEEDQKE